MCIRDRFGATARVDMDKVAMDRVASGKEATAILPLGPTTLPSHKGAIVEAATASRAALATPRATRTKIMTAQVDVQASSRSLLEATNRTLPCTAKARSPVASPLALISMQAILGAPTGLGMEVAVTCPALATATSIYRAAMARSRAAGSREGLEEDSRLILAPSTALASVAVAETFYLCAGGVCCPLSFVPSVHTHMHTHHLPSLVCIGSRLIL